MYLSYTMVIIFSFSIFVSGVIGVFRFNQISSKYKPFIYLIWIGCLNEMANFYLPRLGYYSFINSDIYELCESLLLLWFFKRLGVFGGKKTVLFFLVVLFVSIWVLETFFTNKFGTSFTYYFNLVYFFFVVLFSIWAINNLLFTERVLLKNPTFLICIGLIVFFTYGIIERMFMLYGLQVSASFNHNLQNIRILSNLLTNLIFAFAVLWMHKREAFTLQF
jgi:hypothetical protein